MNMNFSPSTAPSMVTERAMMISSITNSAGMPMVLNFSMPPLMPPLTITRQTTRKRMVNIAAPKGFVSMEPNRSLPATTSAPVKARLERFRDMYSKQ
jgi:hypothetical protein